MNRGLSTILWVIEAAGNSKVASADKTKLHSKRRNLNNRICFIMSTSSEEDDPMLETGPTKRKKRTQKLKVNLKKVKGKSAKAVKAYSEETPSVSGFCVSCQMPLGLLNRWESPEIHAISCLETDFSKLPPCPQQTFCDNTIRSHFSNFNHIKLAELRDHHSTSEDLLKLLQDHPPDSNPNQILTPTKAVKESIEEKVQNEEFSDEDDMLFEELTDEALRIDAVKSEEGDIEIKVKVDRNVELQTLLMKIPSPPKATQIGVVGKISQKRKQSTLDAFFGLKPKAAAVEPMPEKPPSYSATATVQPKTRICPFYKKIPGTSFVVDAFNYGQVSGITHYFLSHFHYDHYGGLTKSWSSPVICSSITAKLIALKIRMNENHIQVLKMNQPQIIQDVEVTCLDANHCPGSVMFLFKLKSGKTILHTGDFRASPTMEEYPQLWNTSISSLYLDTTYCKPEYNFPSQSQVIDKSIQVTQEFLVNHPRTLICVGSYTIGKERIFIALSEAINACIWASSEKKRVFQCLNNPHIDSRIVAKGEKAQIHVVEMSKVKRRDALQEHLGKYSNYFSCILGVIPTGWTFAGKNNDDPEDLSSLKIKKVAHNVFQLSVPYSEHSSFGELRRFVKFLKFQSAEQILATVNVGNPTSRNDQKRIFKQWIEEGPQRVIKQSKLAF